MTDKEETGIREILTTMITSIHAEKDSKYDLIDYKLVTILEQTTKHNQRMEKVEDRVDKIEKNEISHVSNCPQTEKIRTLEDTALSTKSIKRWIAGSVGITGCLIIIARVVFNLIST